MIVICAVPPGGTIGQKTNAVIAELSALKLVDKRAPIVSRMKSLKQERQTASDREQNIPVSMTLDKHRPTTVEFHLDLCLNKCLRVLAAYSSLKSIGAGVWRNPRVLTAS
jgi:hypothetical protein